MIRRAVFLDRDGVINRAFVRNGRPYPPASLQSLEILPRVPEALFALKAHGYALVVVTNQPDVSRETSSRESVDRIHERLKSELDLDAILTCFHDDADECDCRKPKPGLLFRAAADLIAQQNNPTRRREQSLSKKPLRLEQPGVNEKKKGRDNEIHPKE